MKKESAICQLVGLTQEQMAMVLNVSRSQWSLYELGKRDLPIEAKQILFELLKHAQEVKGLKTQHYTAEQLTKKQQMLEKLLKVNEFQLLLQDKKIAAIEKKHEASIRALQLTDFLAKHPNKIVSATLYQSIALKAASDLEKNSLSKLVKAQLKKELLHSEKKLLLKALKKE